MFQVESGLSASSMAFMPGLKGLDTPKGLEVLHKSVASRLVLGRDPLIETRTLSIIGADGVETVLEVDDRQFISETEHAPWRMICWLELEFPKGKTVGTGWFAGPRTVITAGHCVHYRDFGGWAKKVKIVPARDRDESPKFGVAESEDFESNDEWLAYENPEYDFGCIFLKEPLGERTGSFSMGVFPDETLIKYGVNIAGYPKSKDGMPAVKGDHLFHHQNKIRGVSPMRLFYDVDTSAGQSGAPVWIHSDDQAKPIVIGIHANGLRSSEGGLARFYNSSPRIDQTKFDAINEWASRRAGA